MTPRAKPKRYIAALLVSALGAALAVTHTWTANGTETNVILIGVLPFLLMSLALAGAGLWLAGNWDDPTDLLRILGWSLGGGATFASVALLTFIHQQTNTPGITGPLLTLFDLLTAGALAGLLVGAYDARARDHLRHIQKQRDRVEAFARKAADVNNYGHLLNQATTTDEIAAITLEGAALLIGYTEGALLTTDEEEPKLIDTTLSDPELINDLPNIAQTALNQRNSDDTTTIIDDVDHGALRPWLAIPATTGNHTHAILLVATDPDHIHDEDLRLLETLTGHVATALTNHKNR